MHEGLPLQKQPSRIRKGIFLPVQRHSQRVRRGKKILWGLVLGLVAGLMYFAWGNADHEGVRIVFSHVQKGTDDLTTMLRPRYQGVDAKNQPYTVTADSATQVDDDTVLLDKLDADMTMEDASWMSLKAGTGKYLISSKQLFLADGVELFYEDGYEFRTEKASIDVGNGLADSNMPVQGQGPTGTITANSFRSEERGKKLYFNGSVKVTLYP